MRPRDGTPYGRLALIGNRLAQRHPSEIEDETLIWAAVTIVLPPDPDSILLIRRAERAGDPWSGHIAFPGGHRAPSDRELLTTAIRETREEVGLDLHPKQLLGILEDVVPRTPVLPPVAVRPFVFLLPHRAPLVLNTEVASASWATLDEILEPGRHGPASLDVAGEFREMPAYQLADGIVWGMTERILTGLLQYLRD